MKSLKQEQLLQVQGGSLKEGFIKFLKDISKGMDKVLRVRIIWLGILFIFIKVKCSMRQLDLYAQKQISGGSIWGEIRQFYRRMLQDLEGGFGDQAATALYAPGMANVLFAKNYHKTKHRSS